MTFLTPCACPECREMCRRRPCWPTLADAQRLIDARHGHRLMRDWWFDHAQDKTIFLLTPAIAGREGANAPAIPSGACTFLDAHERCTLHDCDLKPTEGKLALCQGRTPEGLHEQVGRTWDCNEGRALVRQWEAQYVTARMDATGGHKVRGTRRERMRSTDSGSG